MGVNPRKMARAAAATVIALIATLAVACAPTSTPPRQTPPSTLQPTEVTPIATPTLPPRTVCFSGSAVRDCAARECRYLGALSAGAKIQPLREEEGEPIEGNAKWLVFRYEGGEAYIHSSLALVTCPTPPPLPTSSPPTGEPAHFLRVIDGDTIEVEMGGQHHRLRYIGVNTPERGEPCYGEAKVANERLVGGGAMTLVRDVSDTDRYDRLLRYVYVDGRFVNEALVREGFAENSVWSPDTRYADHFRALEEEARAANRGCHPSGVFNDGNFER